MKTGDAMELLGLVGTAVAELTPTDIDRAFRRAAVRYHPDSDIARLQNGPAPVTMDEITAARAQLRRVVAGLEFPCKQCRGRGKVPGRVGPVTCGACKGTGDATP